MNNFIPGEIVNLSLLDLWRPNDRLVRDPEFNDVFYTPGPTWYNPLPRLKDANDTTSWRRVAMIIGVTMTRFSLGDPHETAFVLLDDGTTWCMHHNTAVLL
jgi:hypothetical protein